MAFWAPYGDSRQGTVPIPQEELLFRLGQGNWHAFHDAKFDLGRIEERAADWARAISSVEKPWLCWNIDSDWCLAQQKLVRHVGWTPVIGFDPRVGPPREIVPGAVVINFNQGFDLPVLYPHFVMEFAFLIADRLAFWHSDLLVRQPLLRSIAARLDAVPDGEVIVTKSPRSRRYMFTNRFQRYWELVGCTTRAASRSQFEKGAGWWMDFAYHPNCPDQQEHVRRLDWYWDHGTGVYYWRKKYGGRVRVIRDQAIHEGHCTKIGNPRYQRTAEIDTGDALRNMSSELSRSYDLRHVCRELGLAEICF